MKICRYCRDDIEKGPGGFWEDQSGTMQKVCGYAPGGDWRHKPVKEKGVKRLRLDRAREALVKTGYFREDQVGDDIAPRVTELYSFLLSDIRQSDAEVERLREAVEAELQAWGGEQFPGVASFYSRIRAALAATEDQPKEEPNVYYTLQYRIWSGPGSVDAPEGRWTEWADSSYIGYRYISSLEEAREILGGLTEHPVCRYRITRSSVEVVG